MSLQPSFLIVRSQTDPTQGVYLKIKREIQLVKYVWYDIRSGDYFV